MATTSSQTAPLHSVGEVCKTSVRDEHVLVLSLNCSCGQYCHVRSKGINQRVLTTVGKGFTAAHIVKVCSNKIRALTCLVGRTRSQRREAVAEGSKLVCLISTRIPAIPMNVFVSSTTSRTAVEIAYSPYNDPLIGS